MGAGSGRAGGAYLDDMCRRPAGWGTVTLRPIYSYPLGDRAPGCNWKTPGDLQACERLGAYAHHFEIPDCIYRRSGKTGAHLYASEEALWYPVHADEQVLVSQIGEMLREQLSPFLPDVRLVSPLTLGEHIDHRLTRAAAEKVGLPLYFYADFPYVLRTDLAGNTGKLEAQLFGVSPGGMQAW